jgi:DNA polymerase (family 10)
VHKEEGVRNTQPQDFVANAEIADKLFAFAHLLAGQGTNPFRVKAYRRAAKTIRALGESVFEMVQNQEDLTRFDGIGPAISATIREIVETGTMAQLQQMESLVAPEVAEILRHPRLDPKRVLRIYKRLKISSLEGLRRKLESGDIKRTLGLRLDQHVRRGLADHEEILLYEADRVVPLILEFLVERCNVDRIEVAGDYRRRVEVIQEIHFLIETKEFAQVLSKLATYGGRAGLLDTNEESARFRLSSGLHVRVTNSPGRKWGVALIAATGSRTHLDKLEAQGRGLTSLRRSPDTYATEAGAYSALGLNFIPPELREGSDEIELAALGQLPALVSRQDIRGDLHSHSTSSDGGDTLEDMVEAAREQGLEYIGITDHSQSLKIARGLSIPRLRNQLQFLDKLDSRMDGITVLKSAEVDILPDGSLDYPEEILKELDYTICSIHSSFGLGKQEQTDRIRKAMDNPYFTFLGHATGRLLLKRPGYDIDAAKVIEHARQNRCFFELNSTPERLDLPVEHARMARSSGVAIAITTDAHSTHELEFIKYGVEQARRAGFEKTLVLNALPLEEFKRAIRR